MLQALSRTRRVVGTALRDKEIHVADEPHLKMERDGNIVVLTMNNPRRRNALTPEMITLMAQAWDEVDADDTIHVAIFTSEGASYCVGGDLADGWMVRGPKTRKRFGARCAGEVASQRHQRRPAAESHPGQAVDRRRQRPVLGRRL
jgi:enoyl-CoA hydratase/carnithine racemase